MFITQTRLPSQWLGRTTGTVAQALQEGNSLDRVVLFSLILLSIVILAGRSFQWLSFLSHNFFLSLLLMYGLASFMWSDFPAIALKRWIRDLGNYLVILVILSEAQPLEAIQTFLRRLFYLLIPLSILMIKYYTYMSVQYGFFSGLPEYMGAATSKNTLGASCMLSGIFFFWDTVTRWSERKEKRTRRILFVNLAFIMMTYWLLRLSSSATSQVCFVIGCAVVLIHNIWGKHRPALLKWGIPCLLLAYVVLGLGLGLDEMLISRLGRDATYTGRTTIWAAVRSVYIDPLLGAGYDSFWLGDRLYHIWVTAGYVNQAHNGYLEVYLNLGLIGVFLLVGLLISSYVRICRRLTQPQNFGSLALAMWTLALFYNMTEASFKPVFLCLSFLWGAIVIPDRQLSHGLQRSLQKPLQRPLPAKGLRQVDKSRITPKWVEINRLRRQRSLKPGHD
jgi:O-antigen ligase